MPTNDSPRPWVPPLLATVVTLPLGFLALVYAMLSPMACDACDQEENRRFTDSFTPAFSTFTVGLVVAVALLITAWALPRRPVFAVAAPVAVIASWLLFASLVDWPPTT
ncbi:DUF983 domain-containing protein [Streptomyces sp. NPDC053493]|uniref:DUF983 domain-containing protein n=1 Tax=Streptomyces sp. NPDC053493 TaxID=3365705 RepID=UPI0037D2E0B7